MNNNCISLLKSTLLTDISIIKPIITIDILDSPLDSFKKLCEHNILSAPVLDNKKFVGFIDLKDLVQYIIYEIDNNLQNEQIHSSNNVEKIKNKYPQWLQDEGFINIAMHGAAKMYKEPAFGITTKCR